MIVLLLCCLLIPGLFNAARVYDTTSVPDAARSKKVFTCARNNRALVLNEEGIIVSHNGFDDASTRYYPANQNCEWQIRAPSGSIIEIKFHVFDLEYDPRCGYDHVNIYDGPTMQRNFLTKVLCGNQLITFTSSGNTAVIYFHSDWFVSGAGFRAEYSFKLAQLNQAKCGANLQSTSGFIVSHGHFGQQDYPNHWRCRWTITLPPGQRIRLTFSEFKLEKHDRCAYDFLKIYDGPAGTERTLGTFCGTDIPAPLVSTENVVYLVMRTDEGVSDDGFRLTWNQADTNILDSVESQCGRTIELNAPSGFIKSKNYDTNTGYPNNMACEWLIRVSQNLRIRLVFMDVDIEDHPYCQFDYIQVFDGSSTQAPSKGRYCGNKLPQPLTSSWNTMLITFKSDVDNNRRGFKLLYQVVSASLVERTTTTKILTTRTTLPALKPEHTTTTTTTSTSTTTQPARIIGEQQSNCGGPLFIRSPRGYIYSKDFEISTTSTYPQNTECRWRMIAPAGDVITLIFNEFQLEGVLPDCKFDYLKIFSGYDMSKLPLATLCGNERPARITSPGSMLSITFRSDAFLQRRGFNITYVMHQKGALVESPETEMTSSFDPESSGCGGPRLIEVREPGFITSHPTFDNAVNPYAKSARCMWRLSAPRDTTIELSFLSFRIEGQWPACHYDRVSIYRGEKATDTQKVDNYCGEMGGLVIRPGGSQLLITFQSDDSVEMKGFRLKYVPIANVTDVTQAVPAAIAPTVRPDALPNVDVVPPSIPTVRPRNTSGCGGPRMLTNMWGHFHSLNYPNKYPPSHRCEWHIRTHINGSVIQLNVHDLRLEQSPSCDFDHLIVYDGDAPNSQVLRKFCGQYNNNTIVRSTGPRMLVQFVSDPDVTDLGFNASYHVTSERYGDKCSNQKTMTRPFGSIQSPGFSLGMYPPDSTCRWLITAPQGQIIQISFTAFNVEGRTASPCEYDSLRIYDGETEQSTMISNYCGDKRPKGVSTSANHAFLVFKTDNSIQKQGFHLTYKFVVPCSPTQHTCLDGQCISREKRCNKVFDCKDSSDEAGCDVNNEDCGRPYYKPKEFQPKIVGGNAAIPHSWPWQVQINFNGGHYCGGALIDKWWVISAGHCFDDGKEHMLDKWEVVAGKHRKLEQDHTEQRRSVKRVFVHDDYSKEGNNNDVSLIQLERPFNLTASVSHVCLPEDHVRSGYPCYATGWGATEGTGHTGVLKQVMLPVVTGNLCNNLGVTRQMFCAGHPEGKRDTCQGDSGGPLVCKKLMNSPNARWYQQGITSWGIGCADPNSPGVYTKIPRMMDWIVKTMELDGILDREKGRVRQPQLKYKGNPPVEERDDGQKDIYTGPVRKPRLPKTRSIPPLAG